MTSLCYDLFTVNCTYSNCIIQWIFDRCIPKATTITTKTFSIPPKSFLTYLCSPSLDLPLSSRSFLICFLSVDQHAFSFYMNEITYTVCSLFAWLLSLNIWPVKYIQVVVCRSHSFLFVARYCFIAWMDSSLSFIHLTMGFCIVSSNASMNILIQVLVRKSNSLFLRC